ncbi:hypothetical protein [Tsukamurella soli]|uniref:hypothetical protein n=1 Tax=Tsukamurella soli TaxID=644556 RepID=UPI00361970A6
MSDAPPEGRDAAGLVAEFGPMPLPVVVAVIGRVGAQLDAEFRSFGTARVGVTPARISVVLRGGQVEEAGLTDDGAGSRGPVGSRVDVPALAAVARQLLGAPPAGLPGAVLGVLAHAEGGGFPSAGSSPPRSTGSPGRPHSPGRRFRRPVVREPRPGVCRAG